ncbi:hypothetical protein GHT06_008223 [Daphnia sinensis]|uniref:Uncharacterized protein n=1 Tax=Daphnia sinensis TaxID=1820382 RepID=A0AAD5L0V1_9CRUS|nr:hypothetical protein GHT06_008223 [Daphnia sinensis]
MEPENMNNCYSWGEDGESYVEEQDRSLPTVEVSLPTVQQPFQLFDQMLDDEELPSLTELSTSDPDSISCTNSSPSPKTFSGMTEYDKQDVRNVSGIPASVASTSQSLMRTSHSKKFLSRSHNSLVFRPPDYSKVESKVKKYIVSMREQQEQRRQYSKNQFDSAPVPAFHKLIPSSELMAPEDVTNLKQQLADQGAMVEVLQEDHDRLSLHNARLLNMIEEMRTKIRILHAQQHQGQSQQQIRRTNSPPQTEIDKDLSLSNESSLSSHGGDGPPTATQLGLAHQHEALSITPSSYLDLPPPAGQFSRKMEDDETSSCGSSWNSTRLHQSQHEQTPIETPPVGVDKANGTKQTVPEELLLPENNDKPNLLLLKQLQEITFAALEVRDQTRTIIRQINLIQPPMSGET